MNDMKPLPSDSQAEMGVIGSMLCSPSVIPIVTERLSASDFYRLAHQSIYEAIATVYEQHKTVDLVLLRHELSRMDKLEQVGGVGYLAEVIDSVPTSANAEYYVSLVCQAAARRALLALNTLIEQAHDPGADLPDLVRQIESGLDSLAVSSAAAPGVAVHVEASKRLVEQWSEGSHPEVQTGIRPLDLRLDGFLPGTLSIIAGEPRDGKTSLSCNIALNVAKRGQGVLFFSAEMPGAMLTLNMASILSGVAWRQIRQGRFDAGSLAKWDAAQADLVTLPLHIDDTAGIDVSKLTETACAHCRREKTSLIVVDYVQILRSSAYEKRNIQVAMVGAELKRLARETNTAVLALSQVTKDDQDRPHLRWAKELEQDADMVMFLARRKEFVWGSERDEPDIAERRVKIEKNRFGPGGTVTLTFNKPCLRFESRGDDDDWGHDPEAGGCRTADSTTSGEGTGLRGATETVAEVPDGEIPF